MNMVMSFYLIWLGELITNLGVAFIAATALYCAYRYVYELWRREYKRAYRLRITLGKGIIVGLEFIVAGDVIESAAKPDYYHLGILTVVVILRIVLSYVLAKEMKQFEHE